MTAPFSSEEVVAFAPAPAMKTLRLQAFSVAGSLTRKPRLRSPDAACARERPPVQTCTRLVPARRRRGVWTNNKKAHLQGFFRSPLPDSNRRPPSLPLRPATRDHVSPANRPLATCLPCPRVCLRVPAPALSVCKTNNGRVWHATDHPTLTTSGRICGWPDRGESHLHS
jgi:hypothetical protein